MNHVASEISLRVGQRQELAGFVVTCSEAKQESRFDWRANAFSAGSVLLVFLVSLFFMRKVVLR